MELRERVRNAIHAAHNDPSLYAWFHERPEKCRHSQGLADAAIAAVLDAMREPSAEAVKAGEDASWDSGNCMPTPSYTKAAWHGMLAAFRAEALGESPDRDTITP